MLSPVEEETVMRNIGGTLFRVSLLLIEAAILAIPSICSAQAAPPAFSASPEIYQVIGENDSVRVLFAVWKPGQRDNWHSHSQLGVYYLSDCRGRIHLPDGSTITISRKAGETATQPAVKSHAFENTGSTECRLTIVERK
jgi:mannose-6-phosphate isomerase-like protein (cupin superfamily)